MRPRSTFVKKEQFGRMFLKVSKDWVREEHSKGDSYMEKWKWNSRWGKTNYKAVDSGILDFFVFGKLVDFFPQLILCVVNLSKVPKPKTVKTRNMGSSSDACSCVLSKMCVGNCILYHADRCWKWGLTGRADTCWASAENHRQMY